jgi:hypothetical protein
MPGLEAMAAGLAVVASDADARREVAGEVPDCPRPGTRGLGPGPRPGAWPTPVSRGTWACSAERTLAWLTRVARSAGVTAGEGHD